ncbi:MAG: hypothetical protein KGR98_03170 [Verrucomicrobia bacterium]|nr:hypothetical protein [Verrucomicrobiota bacterium]MDE3098679.1 hypothetical protein [Verrucomicrobiota bacterium]
MNSLTQLTAGQLRHAANLAEKIQSLQSELERLLGARSAASRPSAASHPRRGSRMMSAAARARIAAAQRARWAKVRAKRGPVPARRKNRLSAAGRARIVAAVRARWAKAKAARG